MKTDIRRSFARPMVAAALLLAGACASGPLPDGSENEGETASQTSALARVTDLTTTSTPVLTVSLPPQPPPPPPDPIAPTVQALETGSGWRRVQVTGSAPDASTGAMQTLSGQYYVINGRAAINSTSLAANTRAAVAQKVGSMPMPTDGDEEVIIVPKALDDAMQSNVAFFSVCDDSNNQLFSKTYSFSKSYDYHRSTEPGALEGSGDFHTELSGTVTGEVKYSIQYHWCIPTFILHRVTVRGNADLLARANLVAQFKKKWSFEAEVAAPTLGTVSFFGIPVTFKAPITVGLDAQAAATLNLQGSYQAHGAFDVHCNTNGCDGTKTATSGFTPGTTPTFSATGMMTVTPWAEGAVRAYVLDESVVYAQVGVRAKLPAELWAYAGNTCGDADGDGANEFVTGASLDLNVGIDIRAKAGIFGIDLGPWSWNVWTQHLAYWASGDAVAPIFYGNGCGGVNTATMHVGMRPCWPYHDDISYRMNWGDGATTPFGGKPDALLTQTHSFASAGAKSVRVDALTDAKGRTMATGLARTVNVNWVPVVCFDQLTLAQ